jgi:hypothetical protein
LIYRIVYVALRMSKNKIVYGVGFLHLETMQPATHNITSINIDNFLKTCSITIEKGKGAHTFVLTMETAQKIGFINIDAIEPYI